MKILHHLTETVSCYGCSYSFSVQVLVTRPVHLSTRCWSVAWNKYDSNKCSNFIRNNWKWSVSLWTSIRVASISSISSSKNIPYRSALETGNGDVSAGQLSHLNRSLCVHFKSDFFHCLMRFHAFLAGFDLLKVGTDSQHQNRNTISSNKLVSVEVWKCPTFIFISTVLICIYSNWGWLYKDWSFSKSSTSSNILKTSWTSSAKDIMIST